MLLAVKLVKLTNSSFQNYTHPDDHTTRTTGINIARSGVSVPFKPEYLQAFTVFFATALIAK